MDPVLTRTIYLNGFLSESRTFLASLSLQYLIVVSGILDVYIYGWKVASRSLQNECFALKSYIANTYK